MMEQDTFKLPAVDGVPLFVRRWGADRPARAAVQIVHGMAEHAGRYEALARVLNAAGLAVYAHDQRGHGQTASRPEDLGYFGDGVGWRIVVDDLGIVQRRLAGWCWRERIAKTAGWRGPVPALRGWSVCGSGRVAAAR